MSLQGQPETSMQGRLLTLNVPCPNFFLIDTIMIGHQNLLVGGPCDAWLFAPQFAPVAFDAPVITPALSWRIEGRYTGIVPPALWYREEFHLSATLRGPAKVGPLPGYDR